MSSEDDYELILLWEAIDRLLEPFHELQRAEILPSKQSLDYLFNQVSFFPEHTWGVDATRNSSRESSWPKDFDARHEGGCDTKLIIVAENTIERSSRGVVTREGFVAQLIVCGRWVLAKGVSMGSRREALVEMLAEVKDVAGKWKAKYSV